MNIQDDKIAETDNLVTKVQESEVEEFGGKPESERTGTMIGSIFNMANTVIGAGVLAFPFTYMQSGLVLGIFMTFLIVILSGGSMHIIVYCARNDKNAKSYQDIIRKELGNFALKISELLFVANLVGALVCFLVIIADSIQPVLSHYFDPDLIICNRKFIIVAVAVLVVFPLILLREVKKLEFSSTIAIAGVGYLVIMVIVLSVIKFSQGKPLAVGVSTHWGVNVSTYVHVPKMIISIPIIALSFQGIEIICIPIYYELKKATLLKMDIIIFSAMILSASVYVVVGIFGFLSFGDKVDSNILLSYGGDNIPALIARFLMGLTVTLSYPLIFFAMRLAIHSFVVGCQKHGDHDSPIPTSEFIIVSILCHAISVVIAMFVPNISDVFGIVGSFGSMTFVFIYPLLLAIKLVYKSKASQTLKIIGYVLCGIGILIAFAVLVLGEVVTILKMIVEGIT